MYRKGFSVKKSLHLFLLVLYPYALSTVACSQSALIDERGDYLDDIEGYGDDDEASEPKNEATKFISADAEGIAQLANVDDLSRIKLTIKGPVVEPDQCLSPYFVYIPLQTDH